MRESTHALLRDLAVLMDLIDASDLNSQAVVEHLMEAERLTIALHHCIRGEMVQPMCNLSTNVSQLLEVTDSLEERCGILEKRLEAKNEEG